MKAIMITSLAAIGLLGGCVSTQARRGRVVQADVGGHFHNFTFQDERGMTQDLGQNLGDFTVLVFSECGEDLHEPVSNALVDLVRANQEPGYAETVGFDIHWSKDGCLHHSNCHLLEGGPRIFSICDGRARVRDLYGVDSGDQIIVIDPSGRIVSRAPTSEIETVSRTLGQMFAEHAEMVLQTRVPQE